MTRGRRFLIGRVVRMVLDSPQDWWCELPEVREGDLVVIRDTGAYTLAMWSRHCSRGVPALVGAAGGDVELLRERERPEDVVRWWAGPTVDQSQGDEHHAGSMLTE